MRLLPGPYAAWTSWLEAFGRGEDLPAAHLTAVTADLGPQLVERLLGLVAQAFHDRQRRWQEALQRDLKALTAQPAHATTAVAAVLRDARLRLAPLREFTELPQLPEDARANLRSALTETVTSAQRTLEGSIRDAPVEFQSAVRANSLVPGLTRPRTAPATGPARPPGRRVIL
ncbi:hypothetical protein ACQPW3_24485 [Actinosynnema sp. CA-248983]